MHITPHLEIDNFAMAISLVGSTGGVALLPASIDGYLPASIVSRSLSGVPPEIDLMLAFHKASKSPVLEKFLSKLVDLAAQIRAEARQRAANRLAAYGDGRGGPDRPGSQRRSPASSDS